MESGFEKANELDLIAILHDRLRTLVAESKNKYGKPPCTLEELRDAYNDGIEIIKYIKENPLDITTGNNYEFIGLEYPVKMSLNPSVVFTGNIDFIFRDKSNDTIHIKDFKTSTKGWDHWQLNDKSKTQQLLLYKKFYSDIHKVPMDKIFVEYIILKRKLEFPDKERVQLFTPTESPAIIKNIIDDVNKFVSDCFVGANFNTEKVYTKTATNKACMFCDYNNTEHCDAPNFRYNKEQ